MTTARDIIQDALLDINAIGIGETPSDDEASQALSSLNKMIGSWQNDNVVLYTDANSVINFTASQAVYTVGSGGNFNISRPTRIFSVYARDTTNNDYPIEMINTDQFADIRTKQIQSTIPKYVNDDRSFPLRNLTFWPIPSDASWKAVIWYKSLLQSFSSLDDVIQLPDGYVEAIEYNLAIRLAPKYGKKISEEIVVLAKESLNSLKRINYEYGLLNIPDELPGEKTGYTYADFLAGV